METQEGECQLEKNKKPYTDVVCSHHHRVHHGHRRGRDGPNPERGGDHRPAARPQRVRPGRRHGGG